MNSTKITLTNTMIIGVIITICSNNWISIWIGIEVTLLSFIPIIQSEVKTSSESIIKYFIVQRAASTIFLLGVIIILIGVNIIDETITLTALIIKIGLAPFHNWVISVIERIEYIRVMIILTVIKIPPLRILYQINTTILTIPIILRILISSIICINQSSIRKTLGYSSIYNNRIIVISINKYNILLTYLIIYSRILIMIIILLKNIKINFIRQIVFNEFNLLSKINIWVNILSIRGFPLTIGFIAKIIIIQMIIFQNNKLLLIIILVTSILVILFYIRITFTSIFLIVSNKKWINLNNKSKMFIMLINLISTPILMSTVMIY